MTHWPARPQSVGAVLKLRTLFFALAIAISGLVVGAGSDTFFANAAESAPPQCEYQDVLTQHHEVRDWRITLLDSSFMLPQGYVPPNLVSTASAGLNGGERVRRNVVDDLRALATAARDAQAPLRVVSAYRSYNEQRYLYNREVNKYGVAAGRLSVARPGHSEHQLGTTIDFGSGATSKKAWQYNDWASTPAGSFIKANGWKYGFLMSYPKSQRSNTCYRYEPWHYRYVGLELASDVHDTGLTLREYIWRYFE